MTIFKVSEDKAIAEESEVGHPNLVASLEAEDRAMDEESQIGLPYLIASLEVS